MTYAGLLDKRAAEAKEKRDAEIIEKQTKITERMNEATAAKKLA